MKEQVNLKVAVELIPETSFYNNLRKVVSPTAWDMFRRDTYRKYNNKCGKCGVEGQSLDCHEIWHFNEENQIQSLTGLIAVCKMCHHVIHHGYANILISQGKLDKRALINHFLTVNNCDEQYYKEHVKAAFALWRERSKKEWTVEMGDYYKFVMKK